MISSASGPVLGEIGGAPVPMLAKAIDGVPEPGTVTGGFIYEPKWDGFRGIVTFTGTEVEISSRGSKSLTRYFPELVEAFTKLLPSPCVLDGEIVVASLNDGAARLEWDHLTQRIHPAESRVRLLAEQTPAMFIAFDLLSIESDSLLNEPFSVRRAKLETFMKSVPFPLKVSRTTRDVEVARRWFNEFEGAGLDGIVAKSLSAPYAPGKRVMLKTKHSRTADVVVHGYRPHIGGLGIGSILVGLYDDGILRKIGGVSAFSDIRRKELIKELEPYVVRDPDGFTSSETSERSRFTPNKDANFVTLRPELVMEIKYDQLEGNRLRHTGQFLRWRPDRDAKSCTYDQLDRPITYNFDEIFA